MILFISATDLTTADPVHVELQAMPSTSSYNMMQNPATEHSPLMAMSAAKFPDYESTHNMPSVTLIPLPHGASNSRNSVGEMPNAPYPSPATPTGVTRNVIAPHQAKKERRKKRTLGVGTASRQELIGAAKEQIDAIFKDVPRLYRNKAAAALTGYASVAITCSSGVPLTYFKAQPYVGAFSASLTGGALFVLHRLHSHFTKRVKLSGKTVCKLRKKYPELENYIELKRLQERGKYMDFFAEYLDEKDGGESSDEEVETAFKFKASSPKEPPSAPSPQEEV